MPQVSPGADTDTDPTETSSSIQVVKLTAIHSLHSSDSDTCPYSVCFLFNCLSEVKYQEMSKRWQLTFTN